MGGLVRSGSVARHEVIRRPSLLLSLLVLSGCTYAQNRLDDFNDIFTFGAGGTTATEGPLPHSIGIYLEFTEFAHAGALYFRGCMIETDRRGASKTLVERDLRYGLGPFHYWCVDETYEPANRYKTGDMTSWERRMYENTYQPILVGWEGDPWHERPVPAKRLRFPDAPLIHYPRGWQDWGYVGFDIALSEPLLLHAGFRIKFGIDLSQIVDFFIGFTGCDIYGDDAAPWELAEAAPPPPADAGPPPPGDAPDA